MKPKKPNSTVNERVATVNAITPNIAVASTVPTVVLDTDVVSDNMAARLCISFLGHVLFLKNQVPFPIVQLARMPTSDSTTRASKKRHELLNSFDTLASHLYTTFIALSTALALRGSPERAEARTEATLSHPRKHGVARAFFAVALGPTVGTAKSRVFVGIDGLETKVWGLRDDNIPDKAIRMRDVSEGDDGDAVESVYDTDDEVEDEQSEGDTSGCSSEDEDASVSDDNASPPLSRSPSPSSTLSSDSDSVPSTSPLNVPSKSPLLRTEDPETVRAAERLLSRTLASACAEDDGQGLASEMAPTQIHVLLRAPRRFDHPSWIPRQNLCTSLDSYLADFLVESGQRPASCDTTTKKRTKVSKVQGLWVKSRGNSAQIEGSEEELAEEDELIWWSWEGKLVGFADW
ncbi:hypothetical protein J3R83DRAFT_82 [Lanmaoa asiatica]|nr:hypothetical protein J3R83DRAFT_82 [Lanmaoa asiatica]